MTKHTVSDSDALRAATSFSLLDRSTARLRPWPALSSAEADDPAGRCTRAPRNHSRYPVRLSQKRRPPKQPPTCCLMQAPRSEALDRRASPRGTYNLGQDRKWRRTLAEPLPPHCAAVAPMARGGTSLTLAVLDGEARNFQLETRPHGRAQAHL